MEALLPRLKAWPRLHSGEPMKAYEFPRVRNAFSCISLKYYLSGRDKAVGTENRSMVAKGLGMMDGLDYEGVV